MSNDAQFVRAITDHARPFSGAAQDFEPLLELTKNASCVMIGEASHVVWAHNSHVGNARATELGSEGETNIGELACERHPRETVLIGFSTYAGTVTAASDWGGPAERKRVQTALPGSYEELFHRTGQAGLSVRMRDFATEELRGLLDEPRLQRAIGVVYKPETERLSHYYHAQLGRQFDAMIHIDRTRALEPLERTTGWQRGEAPETFPTGI